MRQRDVQLEIWESWKLLNEDTMEKFQQYIFNPCNFKKLYQIYVSILQNDRFVISLMNFYLSEVSNIEQLMQQFQKQLEKFKLLCWELMVLISISLSFQTPQLNNLKYSNDKLTNYPPTSIYELKYSVYDLHIHKKVNDYFGIQFLKKCKLHTVAFCYFCVVKYVLFLHIRE